MWRGIECSMSLALEKQMHRYANEVINRLQLGGLSDDGVISKHIA
jgi:hypothetical protein